MLLNKFPKITHYSSVQIMDIEQEKMAMMSVAPQPTTQSITPPVIAEIKGTISSLNLKSPIKTLKITNANKDDPLKEIILLIGPNTRVAKSIGEEEPMYITANALEENQEITAVYSRDERKSEALFITIKKE